MFVNIHVLYLPTVHTARKRDGKESSDEDEDCRHQFSFTFSG